METIHSTTTQAALIAYGSTDEPHKPNMLVPISVRFVRASILTAVVLASTKRVHF